MAISAEAWVALWIEHRKHNPEKMHLVPLLRNCLSIAEQWDNEEACFEVYNNQKVDYRFMGGFGAFEHIRFSKGLYITEYKQRDDWLKAEPDEQIYQEYLNRANDRYLQTDKPWVKDRPYVLVPLQFIYPKDYYETVALVEWATKNKVYTVFKRHPASSSQSNIPRNYDAFWGVVEKMGITSEYTCFPRENYNSMSMVSQCEMLISVDSAMTLQAMLQQKPTVNLRRCMISDIVPLANYKELDSSVLELKPIPKEEQIRWLTWYWKSCVNDYNSENFKWKINKRRDLYKLGATDVDLHSWKFTKENGLHV